MIILVVAPGAPSCMGMLAPILPRERSCAPELRGDLLQQNNGGLFVVANRYQKLEMMG